MAKEKELVSVRTVQGWHVAQIYKSKLEAAGIPALLKYEALGLVYGITVDGLGAVQVLVPRAYAGEAEALIEDLPDLPAGAEESDEDYVPVQDLLDEPEESDEDDLLGQDWTGEPEED